MSAAGDFSLQGISNTPFAGAIYGVAPHNRCDTAGADDGKMAYGYQINKSGQQSTSFLLCFNAGTHMEWRAVGGPAPVGVTASAFG